MRELARSIARENMPRAGIKRPNKSMSHGRWRAYVRWTPNTTPRSVARTTGGVKFLNKIRKRLAADKVARRTRKDQRRRAYA